MKLTEDKIKKVVELAKDYYDTYEHPSEAKTHTLSEVEPVSLELDPRLKLLFDFIEGMSPQEQAELAAVMWIGRKNYGADQWNEALAQAKVTVESGGFSEYMASKKPLADYLRRGFAELMQSEES